MPMGGFALDGAMPSNAPVNLSEAFRTTARQVGLWICLGIVAGSSQLSAQPPSDGKTKSPGPFFALSGSLLNQLDASLESAGSYSVSSVLIRASVAQPISRKTILALSLGYDYSDYDFSEDAVLESASPWDKVHAFNLAFPVIRKIGDRWSILVSPSVGSYGASGATFGDSLTWGAVLAATYSFRADRKLGFGLGAFDRIGESRGFPFVAIDWQLADRWRLANPLSVGPTGPAGLEVVYKPAEKWELGLGGAYRNIRFRLDDQDLEPNGIGEQRGVVTFARALHSFSPKLDLIVYAGMVTSGELRIEDESAQRRRTTEHDAAPILALTLSGRF